LNPIACVTAVRTSTLWSHALTVGANGNIYDPTIGGVKVHKNYDLSDYKGRYVKVMRHINLPKLDQANMCVWMVKTQKISKGYDYKALFGFLTGLKALEDDDKWYCTEFPYWAFQGNGPKLTNEDLTFVYPPFFVQCNDFDCVWEGKIEQHNL
jgi:hypothetical protein